MTIETFKEYAKTRQALDSEEIRRFMDEMSNEARRVTFRLNASFHTADEVRGLLSDLFGYRVPPSLRVFPPFYTDFGKNIAVGDEVFINACCHFQDHGGVTLGDGCQIGHNVVFATLDHGLAPEDRKTTYPAPIVLGKNVWIGSNATILQGVTIGDNAVVGAGTVVTKDVEAAVFLYETEDGYKVSMRSNGGVDVARVAMEYGGGGHVRAAGVSMEGNADKILEKILEEMKKQLPSDVSET